ncbi:MAG: hypothetical protein AB1697_10555 [Pseudomonadota bacterium]
MNIQRRINHTGRIRIDKSRVEILLEGEPGSQRFTATVNFDGLDLPPGAPVHIEAYQRYALQRFDCGTVATFSLPPDSRLTELDGDLPIQFRVKVVDTAGPDGRLLAAVRGIRASNEQPDAEGREKLLPVVSRDMGELPWRVNFQEDSVPELALNNRIPGCIERIRHDPSFQAMVFPAAVRSILSWIYWRDLANNGEEWVTRWLVFAGVIAGEEAPKGDDPTEVESWIEDVVNAFSRKHNLCTRLVGQIGRAGE